MKKYLVCLGTLGLIFYGTVGLAQENFYPKIRSKEIQNTIFEILSKVEVAEGELTFGENTQNAMKISQELVDAGYIRMYSYGGGAGGFNMNAYITLKGRDYLEELRSRQFWPTLGRLVGQFVFWVVTIAFSAVIASAVKRRLGLSGGAV